jgi:hypothetical protein
MTSTPDSTTRAVKAAATPMELQITRERITDSVAKRRATDKDPG